MPKRLFSLALAFIFLFIALTARIGYISLSNTYSVADTYNSINININKLYTNIYSSDGYKLNNCFNAYRAVIRPNERALSELDKLFDNEKCEMIRQELSEGYPIVVDADYKKLNYINIIPIIKENDEKMLCRHMLDKTCGGLEFYTDKEIGSLKISFGVDAIGRVLRGDSGTLINDNYDSVDGIIISINHTVQTILEDSCRNLYKGSAVVLDVKNAQIIGALSKGGDYINRSVNPYSIGSIFKLVVCICALENGVNPEHKCTGSVTVGDTVFHCQKNKKHGSQNMKSALANSCNCYFIRLALELGRERLYRTAKALGFGSPFTIYNSWQLDNSVFPTPEELSSDGQLALIGFGQGRLTDTPVHFAAVVSAIANGGIYNPPTLDITDREGTRVFSEKTAQALREYMHFVVTDGTGKSADYNNSTAGKTATAQSGIYVNGKEQLNTWFAGFYPYENPKYAIVIMCEGGKSGAEDCCPYFSTIVEKLEKK